MGLLLVGALYWEKCDILKIWNMKPVHTIKNKKYRKLKEQFIATFMYKNNIMWRSIYISATISIFIIGIFMRYYASTSLIKTLIMMFFVIFIVFYFTHIYRTFHIYRVLASKIDRKLLIMEDM